MFLVYVNEFIVIQIVENDWTAVAALLLMAHQLAQHAVADRCEKLTPKELEECLVAFAHGCYQAMDEEEELLKAALEKWVIHDFSVKLNVQKKISKALLAGFRCVATFPALLMHQCPQF